MAEYLQNMKTLRTQMNVFEDQAANISFEEEKQKTAIHTVQKDLEIVRAEILRVEAETDELIKAKARLCSLITEKMEKQLNLANESSTLSRTLELLHQEKATISTTLKEKGDYYGKILVNMKSVLQGQQEWFHEYKHTLEAEDRMNHVTDESSSGMHLNETNNMAVESDEKVLTTELDLAEANIAEMNAKQSEFSSKNVKTKLDVDDLKRRIEEFPLEMRQMSIELLQEEHGALLSDKAREQQYFKSLQQRTEEIKGISEMVKCNCGVEYRVSWIRS